MPWLRQGFSDKTGYFESQCECWCTAALGWGGLQPKCKTISSPLPSKAHSAVVPPTSVQLYSLPSFQSLYESSMEAWISYNIMLSLWILAYYLPPGLPLQEYGSRLAMEKVWQRMEISCRRSIPFALVLTVSLLRMSHHAAGVHCTTYLLPTSIVLLDSRLNCRTQN